MCAYVMCLWMYPCVSVCVFMYVCAYVCVHVYLCVYVYVYMCALVHVHTISGKILRNRVTVPAFGEANRRLMVKVTKKKLFFSPLDPTLYSTPFHPWTHFI